MEATGRATRPAAPDVGTARDTETYRVVRFFAVGPVGLRVIKRGLTLTEAQAHCRDPETSSRTATSPEARDLTERLGPWFDGYEPEER